MAQAQQSQTIESEVDKMGLFDKLFKPKEKSEEGADRSDDLMERLKMRRGQQTGKYLALMEDASKAPPELGPAPTIEGIDKRQVLDDKPYVPPLASQYMTLSPGRSSENPGGSATPFGQEPNAQPNEVEAFAEQSSELNTAETVAQGELPQQPSPQTTDAQPNAVQKQIAMLATWSACSALLTALDSDLAWLAGKEGSSELEKDQAEYLHDLSAALRALSGQVDGVVANYHPTQGSKYNQS